ncbi:DUF6193 family natural product biosynthesis protein [Kitasatospora sp. NPDC002227]|uniref:DUF6193 family natural product biosynthesis protein n=1 Tax=Kitasatospora sp. NPDC002227 TaxID=3154773 RepID=UPI003319785C
MTDAPLLDLAAVLSYAAAQHGLALPPPAIRTDRRAVFGDEDGGLVSVHTGPRDSGHHRVRCNRQGAWLAGGMTAETAAVVGAVAAWVGGASLSRTKEAAPFIHFEPWALAHEREPFGPVELSWWHLIDAAGRPWARHRLQDRQLALLRAAQARPELRRLTPVTSHFTLWFSATPTYPYERVGCSIEPRADGYLLRYRGSRTAIHLTTPEEAVSLAVAALPGAES